MDSTCMNLSDQGRGNWQKQVVQKGGKMPTTRLFREGMGSVINTLEEAVIIANCRFEAISVNQAARKLLDSTSIDTIKCYLEGRIANGEDFIGCLEKREKLHYFTLPLDVPLDGGKFLVTVIPFSLGSWFHYLMILDRVSTKGFCYANSDIVTLRLTQGFRAVTRLMNHLLRNHDPYSAAHSEGVGRLSAKIGQSMGFTKEECEGLEICGLLHDIGKAFVPPSILNKPGRLSRNEWQFLKEHPAIAYESLRYIPFPWPVAEVVHQHHERLDGSGYPRGLRGDEIHLWASILAVADVVDAMSNHRPYRPALPKAQVVYELQSGSGVLYDPRVVSAYMRLVEFEERRIMVVDDQCSGISSRSTPAERLSRGRLSES